MKHILSYMLLCITLPVNLFASLQLRKYSDVRPEPIEATLYLTNNKSKDSYQSIPDGLSINLTLNNRRSNQAAPLSRDQQLPVLLSEIRQSVSLSDAYANRLAITRGEARQAEQLLTSLCQTMRSSSPHQILKNIHTIAQTVVTENEVRNYWCQALSEIKTIITDSYGNIKNTFNSSDFEKVDNVIKTFREKITVWGRENNSYQSAYYVVSNFSQYEDHQKYMAQVSKIFDDVVAYNRLKNVENLCRKEKFEEAQDIIKGCRNAQQRKMLEETFSEFYDQWFTPQGIDKDFIHDPEAQKLAAQLPIARTPTIYNKNLRHRFDNKKAFLKKYQIHLGDAAQTMVYHIMDHMNINSDSALEFICTNLSSDHLDATMRDVYNAFHDPANKLPKICVYNNEVTHVQFPDIFATQAFSSDRLMLTQVGRLDTTNEVTKQKVEQFVAYMQRACTAGDSNATAYRTLANVLGNALITNSDHCIVSLQDYTKTAPSYHQEAIKGEVVKCIAERIKTTEKNPSQTAQTSTLVSKVDGLYTKMCQGDHVSQALLEKGLYPTPSEAILLIDLNEFQIPEGLQTPDLYIQRIESYAKAQRDVEINGVQSYEKDYFPIGRTQFYILKELKKNPAEFRGKFIGNQLEHALHEGILDNFKKAADLHHHGIREQHKELFAVGNRSNCLAFDSLKIRDYLASIHLTVFAARVFEYIEQSYAYKIGSQIVIGSGQGFIAGIQNMAHMVRHPGETLRNTVLGLWHLTCGLQRFYNYYCGWRNVILLAPIQGFGTVQVYCRQICDVSEQIFERLSHLSVQDVCKYGTQFVTEAVVTGEILEFLGMASKVVGTQAKLIISDIRADAQAMTVIEGLEVKATAQAEKNCSLLEGQIAQESQLLSHPLVRDFNPKLYNSNIVNVDQLTQVVEKFGHMESALGSNGPLKQVLEGAKLGLDETLSLKGPMFELEKALELEARGEKVIEFGRKIGGREFDIVTERKLIECKNWDWDKYEIERIKSNFGDQNEIAKKIGLIFEVHSKNVIPITLKTWLYKKQIKFFEG